MCRRLSSPVLILAFALACVTASVPAGAQTPGVVVHVQAGWNLIPGRGSDLSDKTNFIGPRVYTLQPGDRDYEDFPAVSTTLKLGWGYWVYFTQNTDITLNPAGGSNEPLGITAPAGQYFMAGNPSSTQAATISGADAVYTYDPLNGYRSTTTLQPYQGAWVLSTTGGTITVTPLTGATTTVASPPATGSNTVGCLPNEQLTYHVHAHLAIFVEGQPVTVPANTGITSRCIAFLHTHDTSGIIHIEAPQPRAYTLGDFFQVWGQPLDATHLLNRVAANPGDITVFVNGRPFTGSPDTIPLQSHTVVVLEFGQPVLAPPPYVFPPGYFE